MRLVAVGAIALVAAADVLLGGTAVSPVPSPSPSPSRVYLLTPQDVSRIGRELEAAFGVRVSGQWRSPEEDARRREATGRRRVSDHVFGMALDLVGPAERLDALAAYLRARPEVAYVLWKVPLHFDHLHASFR